MRKYYTVKAVITTQRKKEGAFRHIMLNIFGCKEDRVINIVIKEYGYRRGPDQDAHFAIILWYVIKIIPTL